MRTIPARVWLLAALSGALQVLPFPIAGPVPIWRTAFCWVALLPLLMALLERDRSGRLLSIWQAAAVSYLSGILWYLGNCYWIFRTMNVYGGISKPASAGILILFCLYLGLYHALFGAAVSLIGLAGAESRLGQARALLLSAPFVWVAVELARARITGFPWDLLGTTQVDSPLLTRLAPFTGCYGLSFVIAAVNALWLMPIAIRQRRHTRTVLTAAGVGIVVLYLVFLQQAMVPVREAGSATATLVQENLEVGMEAKLGPQITKEEMFREFSRLSEFPGEGGGPRCNGIPELPQTRCGISQGRSAVNRPLPTDLIIWPESPAPFEEADPEFRDAMSQVAKAASTPVIVGDISVEPDKSEPHGIRLQNSAEFIGADGIFVGRYDKMHLVPFGEYVPFKRLFFFAGNLLADVGEFSPGVSRSVFGTNGHRYGTFICYESIFGDEVREYPGLGADVLVNISNDGWYGDTSAPWEHLNMVRMRAIENHRWVLRATNTGITGAIDPHGRVTAALPRHIRSSIVVGFDYEHDVTFYARHGDWFAYLCAMVTALSIATAYIATQRTAAKPMPNR